MKRNAYNWVAYVLAGCSLLASVSSAVEISTASLPVGKEMEAYGATLQAMNGTPPYTWSVMPAVVGWGYNGNGQCDVPSGLSDVVAIAGGGFHSLALRSDGTVVGWGSNGYGQCDVPLGLADVVAIAAGYFHSLALKSDGTVVGWGSGWHGKVTWSSEVNVPPGLSDVVAIAAGEFHCVALRSDRTVVAWGDNEWGQTDVPPGLSDVVAIAAGYYHNLALKSDRTVVAWGEEMFGQCDVPAGLSDVVAIAAGYIHSLALKSDGTVVAWGETHVVPPDMPAGLSDVVAIAEGFAYSLALKSDGTVVAWGYNANGQCDVPPGLGDVVAIAAGAYNGMALRSKSPQLPEGLSCSSSGIIAGTPILAGTKVVTFVVQDSVGARATKSIEIIVVPVGCNRSPVARCKDVTVSAGADGTANASVDNSSYDPDDDPITLAQTPPGPYTLGNTLVTLTITDSEGLSDTCQATVTVLDTTPPIITCPAAPADIPTDANCQAKVPALAATVTGGNGPVTLWQSPAAGTPIGLGTTEVTITAKDAAGNTASCDVNVTVVDQTAPVITCPADIGPVQPAVYDTDNHAVLGTATVNDNCDWNNPTVIHADVSQGTINGIETITRTWKATDPAGNVSEPCVQTITVQRNRAPVAKCKGITVELGLTGTASITPTDVDNGSFDPDQGQTLTLSLAGLTSYTGADVGKSITVTLTVKDPYQATDSCTATVTVEDKVSPVIMNFSCAGGAENSFILGADVTDNCGVDPNAIHVVTYGPSDAPQVNTLTLTPIANGYNGSFTLTPAADGTYTSVWSVADLGGNSTTATNKFSWSAAAGLPVLIDETQGPVVGVANILAQTLRFGNCGSGRPGVLRLIGPVVIANSQNLLVNNMDICGDIVLVNTTLNGILKLNNGDLNADLILSNTVVAAGVTILFDQTAVNAPVWFENKTITTNITYKSTDINAVVHIASGGVVAVPITFDTVTINAPLVMGELEGQGSILVEQSTLNAPVTILNSIIGDNIWFHAANILAPVTITDSDIRAPIDVRSELTTPLNLVNTTVTEPIWRPDRAVMKFFVKKLGIDWKKDKPDKPKMDKIAIDGRLDLPAGYSPADLGGEAVVIVEIGGRAGTDVVLARVEKDHWKYKTTKYEAPAGVNMDIKKLTINWEGKEGKLDKFRIDGALDVANDGSGLVTVTVLLPVPAGGDLSEAQTVSCELKDNGKKWEYKLK